MQREVVFTSALRIHLILRAAQDDKGLILAR